MKRGNDAIEGGVFIRGETDYVRRCRLERGRPHVCVVTSCLFPSIHTYAYTGLKSSSVARRRQILCGRGRGLPGAKPQILSLFWLFPSSSISLIRSTTIDLGKAPRSPAAPLHCHSCGRRVRASASMFVPNSETDLRHFAVHPSHPQRAKHSCLRRSVVQHCKSQLPTRLMFSPLLSSHRRKHEEGERAFF